MKLDLLSWAERFVATPSVSRDGNAAISEVAAELLCEAGLEPRFEGACVEGLESVVQRNLVADLGPDDGDDGLLLVTHLDTVPPGDPELWTASGGDPFRPTRDGERLYGLGSADAKVDFVCKAFALAEIERGALRRRLRIVGTFAEEIGLRGARHLVETGGTRGFRYALVGEPSELVAIHAHKGYAVFEARLPAARHGAGAPARSRRVVLEGQAAHSSTPHLGTNAIEGALARIAAGDVVAVADLTGGEAVNRVPDRCTLDVWEPAAGRDADARADASRDAGGAGAYPVEPLLEFRDAWSEFVRSLRQPSDSRFDPDHTVASLGRVAFEEGCPVFWFDVRTVPGVDAVEAVRKLEGVAEVECMRSNAPLATPLDSPLVAAVTAAQREAGLEARTGTKATSTEAGLLASAGLDVVVIGAGLSVGNVHRPNEYTRIPELSMARDVYASAIRRLCCGGAG